MHCLPFEKVLERSRSVVVVVEIQVADAYFVQIRPSINAMSGGKHMSTGNQDAAAKPFRNVRIFRIRVSENGEPRPSTCKVNRLSTTII